MGVFSGQRRVYGAVHRRENKRRKKKHSREKTVNMAVGRWDARGGNVTRGNEIIVFKWDHNEILR